MYSVYSIALVFEIFKPTVSPDPWPRSRDVYDLGQGQEGVLIALALDRCVLDLTEGQSLSSTLKRNHHPRGKGGGGGALKELIGMLLFLRIPNSWSQITYAFSFKNLRFLKYHAARFCLPKVTNRYLYFLRIHAKINNKFKKLVKSSEQFCQTKYR